MQTDPSRPRGPLALFLLAWIPAALLAVHMKWTIVSETGGGLDFLAHFQGVQRVAQVPLVHRLALLREDLLVAGTIAPLILLLVLWRLAPRARAVTAAACSILVMAILYIELKCYWEVGAFLSGRVLAAGVFGSGRKYAGQYLPVGSLIKLGASVAFAFGASALVVIVARRGWLPRLMAGLEQFARIAVLLPATAAIALYALPHPRTPFDSSAMRESLGAFGGLERISVETAQYTESSGGDILAKYAQLTKAPLPNAHSPYFGKAAGYDVIVLLFESLPARCATLAGEAGFPTVARLANRSFVAPQHYATYPYSRRAYFSIFSGWYPTSGILGNLQLMAGRYDTLVAPGVVRTAVRAGYTTAMFNPEMGEDFERDDLRFRTLGFQRQINPPNADSWHAVADSPDGMRLWRRGKDRETLELMKGEIVRATSAGRRYLFAFNPQSTHGPWPGIDRTSDEVGACATGIEVFRTVDAWLGEIVELLAKQGTLERTLIVTLGDHGLRTRREFPPFWGGTLDDITFHVPMQIFAPGVLESRVDIPWMTSHIDIAPSILDLLGLADGRALEQGSPMWEPRLAKRKTFLLARSYLGADGVRDGGDVVMVKYLFGGVARAPWNGMLHFRPEDLLQKGVGQGSEVTSQFYAIEAIQQALAELMAPEKSAAFYMTAAATH
jgi:sulfatase-like protein